MHSTEHLPTTNETTSLELLKQQDAHQFEIAKFNIEATLVNQREIRQHLDIVQKRTVVISSTIIGTLFIFAMYALYLNKEAFLSDILKVALGAFGGGGVGYAIGNRRGSPHEK